jgi:uncharacterized protein (TIGR03435 family)
MVKRGVIPATVLLLAGSMIVALPLCAQGTVSTLKPLAYDVVTIKPHDPSDGSSRTHSQPDGYTVTNVGLKSLLQQVYNLQTEEQISGLPKWADSARYDLQAKMDDDTVATLKKLPSGEYWAQRSQMMQALLADRFQLKVHHETRSLPIYSLSLAKGGPKLKDHDPNLPPGSSSSPRSGQFTSQGLSLFNLVFFLSGTLHRQVVDNTGLSGKYDMSLRWSPDEVASAPQEQLGLKLESTKGPVDTIVVDHVAMPSEN